MINLANFQITGRIGNVRHTDKLTRVAVAYEYQTRDKHGAWSTETSWLNVTVFNENLRDRLDSSAGRPGNLIQIEGRPQSNKYEKGGQTIFTIDLIANDMAVLQFAKEKDPGFDEIPY